MNITSTKTKRANNSGTYFQSPAFSKTHTGNVNGI